MVSEQGRAMAEGTRTEEFRQEMSQMVQEAEQCQQRPLKESVHEIESLIGGLTMQWMDLLTKQKLEDMTEGEVATGSIQKAPWGQSTKLEFLKFNGVD